MTTIHFISIRDQQNFEDDSKNKPRRNKDRNDKIQNMFEKYRETLSNLSLKSWFFLSAVKNEMQKKFVTVGGLMDTKYCLINGKLYQTNN